MNNYFQVYSKQKGITQQTSIISYLDELLEQAVDVSLPSFNGDHASPSAALHESIIIPILILLHRRTLPLATPTSHAHTGSGAAWTCGLP